MTGESGLKHSKTAFAKRRLGEKNLGYLQRNEAGETDTHPGQTESLERDEHEKEPAAEFS